MLELLLAAALAYKECLDNKVYIVKREQHTIAKVDLTGDKKEELLFYYFSLIDSSSCSVYARGDSLVKLFEGRFSVKQGDWRLYLGDYNNDCVYDFTISPPDIDLYYYVTWNKEIGKFEVVVDSSFAEPRK